MSCLHFRWYCMVTNSWWVLGLNVIRAYKIVNIKKCIVEWILSMVSFVFCWCGTLGNNKMKPPIGIGLMDNSRCQMVLWLYLVIKIFADSRCHNRKKHFIHEFSSMQLAGNGSDESCLKNLHSGDSSHLLTNSVQILYFSAVNIEILIQKYSEASLCFKCTMQTVVGYFIAIQTGALPQKCCSFK